MGLGYSNCWINFICGHFIKGFYRISPLSPQCLAIFSVKRVSLSLSLVVRLLQDDARQRYFVPPFVGRCCRPPVSLSLVPPSLSLSPPARPLRGCDVAVLVPEVDDGGRERWGQAKGVNARRRRRGKEERGRRRERTKCRSQCQLGRPTDRERERGREGG